MKLFVPSHVKQAIDKYQKNFHNELIDRVTINTDSCGYICKGDERIIISVNAISYKKKRIGSNRAGMGTRVGRIYVGGMNTRYREEYVPDCQGVLTITTKNVSYNGQKTSFVWPHAKIVNVSSYKDSIIINPNVNSKGPYCIGGIPNIKFDGVIVDDVKQSDSVKFSFPLTYSILRNLIIHLSGEYND